MTVATTTNKRIATGDGSTTPFPFTFEFFLNSEIQVFVDGVQKTEITDYTLVNDEPGGTVTFLVAPANLTQILIKRVLPQKQTHDYIENDNFPAEVHEESIDRVVMIVQQQQEELDRTPHLDVDTTLTTDDMILPDPVASTPIGWNATADGLANITTLTGTAVGTFGATLIDDNTQVEAVETLGLTGGFKVTEQAVPDMTVLVGAGEFYDRPSLALVTKAAQTSATITAPTVDPRRDIVHIDITSGVIGVTTGAEAASPVDPTIPKNTVPLARVNLTISTTSITDAIIDDIRSIENLGTGPQDIRKQTFTAFDDTGAVNAYVITPDPAITAYAKYQTWVVDIATENTGASTMNINGLGARNIFNYATNAALTGSEMPVGIHKFIDDGTQLLLMTPRTGVLQIQQIIDGEVATGTTVLPQDDTIPQNTEGDEYMTLAITPKSASSRLKIEVSVHCAVSTAQPSAALFRDSIADALAAAATRTPSTNAMVLITFAHDMASPGTSATTFKVRAGSLSAATTTFNGQSGARLFGGVLASSIIITEYI